jgi:hypothetical protein
LPKVKSVTFEPLFRSWATRTLALSIGLAGCRDEPAPPAPPGTSGAPNQAPADSAQEASQRVREEVEKAVNPKGLPVYSGPVGAVRGVVNVTGDPPPFVTERAEKLPREGCPRAQDLYRKLYRQGPERTLADVLVTVTEYSGYLRPPAEPVRVEIEGCAFDRNVVAMTFGQHLEVFNLDSQPYMPRLLGPPSYALRVAMPRGGSVPLYAPRPGKYVLAEETREYMRAEVFVLNYPTVRVTGLDGRFEMTGIPTGTAKVTAYAVAIGKISEQTIQVETGVTKDLSFALAFSQAEYDAPADAARTTQP